MTDSTQSLHDLRNADNASRSLGIALHEANSGRIEVGLIVTDAMLNFGGTCHGGVLFHLADTAMSYVSNQDNQPAVATAATIDYVSPAYTGDDVRATIVTVPTNAGGRNAVHDGVISVGDRVVALFRGKTLLIKGAKQ